MRSSRSPWGRAPNAFTNFLPVVSYALPAPHWPERQRLLAEATLPSCKFSDQAGTKTGGYVCAAALPCPASLSPRMGDVAARTTASLQRRCRFVQIAGQSGAISEIAWRSRSIARTFGCSRPCRCRLSAEHRNRKLSKMSSTPATVPLNPRQNASPSAKRRMDKPVNPLVVIGCGLALLLGAFFMQWLESAGPSAEANAAIAAAAAAGPRGCRPGKGRPAELRPARSPGARRAGAHRCRRGCREVKALEPACRRRS